MTEQGSYFNPDEIQKTEATTTIIGDVWNPADRENAAQLVAEGRVIGVFNRGPGALWVDGANHNANASIRTIKGAKRGENQPLAATFPTEQFVSYIDPAKVHEGLHTVFLNAAELAARTGSLCFVRAPITEAAANVLPPAMVSKTEDGTLIVQNWDPKGHRPTYLLLERMRELGIKYPAVTSMNVSGTPEVSNQEEGVVFAQQHNLPIYLKDSRDNGDKVSRSYTIIGVGKNGVEGVRNGNIPLTIISSLIEYPIIIPENIKTIPTENQYHPSETLLNDLNPHQARIAIIADIHDYSEAHIRDIVTRFIS